MNVALKRRIVDSCGVFSLARLQEANFFSMKTVVHGAVENGKAE